jgi:hypothetical protein
MKIFLVLLVVYVASTMVAQTPMPSANDMNIVGFAGGWGNVRNLNNSGMWGGVYLDKNLTKSSGLSSVYSLGFFSVVNWSNYKDNLAPYSADNRDVALGLALGLYSKKFSANQPLFIGLNIGLKHSADDGESGKFFASQKDWSFLISLNLDFMKNPKPGETMWPRTQLQVSLEDPFSTKRNSFWDNTPIEGRAWNKRYLSVLLKESIFDYYFSPKIVLSPKLLLGYSHSAGNMRDEYGIGLELSLHKIQDDDFLAVFYMLKGDIRGQMSAGVLGLQVNLIKII